uniref:Uncharacterized protein n=1 Tax=viral metagenome TaxID=1070528 RepID=A0A6M3JNU9_9ZZZZ
MGDIIHAEKRFRAGSRPKYMDPLIPSLFYGSDFIEKLKHEWSLNLVAQTDRMMMECLTDNRDHPYRNEEDIT